MFDLNRIKAELLYEKGLLKKITKQIARLPKTKLYAFDKKGIIYFRAYKDGKVKYLGTEGNPGIKAAQKRYLAEQIICRLNNNIALMDNFINNYQEFNPVAFLDQLPVAYKKPDDQILVDLGFLPGPNKMSSSHNDSYYPENLVHKTISGITVRSRVEAIIADFYTSLGIVFSYEERLIFKDGTSIRPDFTIRDNLGNIIVIHEHIGMVGDEKYWESFIWKLRLYLDNDYIPGNTLLFTYDSIDQSIDTSLLKNNILYHLKKNNVI